MYFLLSLVFWEGWDGLASQIVIHLTKVLEFKSDLEWSFFLGTGKEAMGSVGTDDRGKLSSVWVDTEELSLHIKERYDCASFSSWVSF